MAETRKWLRRAGNNSDSLAKDIRDAISILGAIPPIFAVLSSCIHGQFGCLRPAMAEACLAVIATLTKGYNLDCIWLQVDCDLADSHIDLCNRFRVEKAFQPWVIV
jgi:hypothetical protein